jgi:enamine deaminase RidA (YjgF/YER057c/UK114 family)
VNKKSIISPGLESYYRDWHMSPGLICDGFVFLTGFTGTRPDGTISMVPAEQIRQAFRTVESVLKHGGLGFEHIVEMTTYHVGLQDQVDLFRAIRDEFIMEPYPAWTAIEVAGLVTKAAIVEIRVIAHQPQE